MESEHKYILEVKNLQKAFGRFVALDNINLSIQYGRIAGLLGKNGAGKTTLIKTILGLYKNYEGEIYYCGSNLDHGNCKIMNTIGSLVDTAFYEDFSAYDNLKILLMSTPDWEKNKAKKKINELLEFVGLEHQQKDKVKSFSFGMKQRLALAQSLLVEPKLLILDEPFVGLDPLGIELVKQKLRSLCSEKKVSIIFSSHQLSEVAEMSEDLIVINNGKLSYSGTYNELLNKDKQYMISLDQPLGLETLTRLKSMCAEITNDDNIVNVPYSYNNIGESLNILVSDNYRITEISIKETSLIQLFKE